MNPYKKLRLQAGLTQARLAKESSLSRNYVLRVEQGLYSTPSPKLETTLSIYLSDISLLDTYHVWIRNERAPVAALFFPRTEYFLRNYFSCPEHPHKCYRQVVIGNSLIEYCRTVKIQQSIIQAYELSTNTALPFLLKEALLDCGVPSIADLEKRFSIMCNRPS
jgi:transcriptional regulator with XRE-family HTH domain